MSLEVIILAAGKGSRMHSHLPKVLHKVGGKEILQHVIDNSLELNPEKIHIVYGFGGSIVKDTIGGDYDYVMQKELLGTGHAVMQALPNCNPDSKILILVSDIPLITSKTLRDLVNSFDDKGIAVLTSVVEHPEGLGRIKRDSSGNVLAIVEDKDCTPEEKLINEINTGVIAGDWRSLNELLKQVKNNNNQGEYYLTDVISLACQKGISVSSAVSENSKECEGINNKVQLAEAERYYQLKIAKKYMTEGLILLDPSRVDFRGTLEFGANTSLDANVIIEGNVKLGNNVVIGAGCVLKNCSVGDDSVISPYTVIEDSEIGKSATLGPFARFRPGCVLEDQVHVGNFVEVKKSKIAKGTKAGHLSYLGDSDIGENVNIGAGTITCNYDGANKWKTVIGNNVFVGSDTQIVAPVEIGDNVTIGAGTTVTKNVEADNLVITRAPLRSIKGWKRPVKKK
ncbi:MAG: bifunctional UDP-N-acetylglucosamine diphosphorylase/glucosamine-1-phosphate N-acetyltransferase GlmU [Ruminobacter sp.]|uniref:Bifunctional protein GlmU n=1 Tax=Ruminobacter amylophilus TaxID=867 RepID=A0A662ZK03_9GAMM|nr:MULTISPECIES: bifunctional UDP-N-acetylglucosamine diphosphorylase/glucosamine-1-phosphate N-acetyltransferase GlmU [Ruminobacter]MBQ3775127.1 bifunctional UDP-N-acetylglucosamine diphosphorylase/glucosamine-1-phosphate N-acetyltransferase GlmU [Ruminobacter sp.]SFP56318.1 bifunctional UDP-N-acetylglucosamine pyrophosphorylase / Glucosamine-1-phosphate N-acetyltransferase [Ruminobacter amylophilus]